jgi:hypothetical protein
MKLTAPIQLKPSILGVDSRRLQRQMRRFAVL